MGLALRASRGKAESVMLGLISFAISAHTFPIMPWTTVDGLCLVSVGSFLCLRRSNGTAKTLGYILLGCACLCRQTYIAVIPLAAVVLGDWRRARYWLAAAAPLAAYAAYLYSKGAVPSAMLQFSARSALIEVGVLNYLREGKVAWAAIFGYFAMSLVIGVSRAGATSPKMSSLVKQAGVALLYLVFVLCAAAIGFGKSSGAAFVLFGCALGCVGRRALEDGWLTEPVRAGTLALAIAWCASISLGANTPALAAGVFVPLIAAYCYTARPNGSAKVSGQRLRVVLTVGVAVLTMFSFARGRTRYVYRDRPASELNRPLGQVLAGGNGIQTNEVTYNFLFDLDKAIEKCGTREYAVVPDVAAHWIRSSQHNPLSIDWAQRAELPIEPLMDRVIREIDERRGRVVVIVAKVRARSLASAENPLDLPEEDISAHVRASWHKLDETRYFDLYE